MRVIAVNGSPRKTHNTASLLQKALDGAKYVGADTEMIHLADLQFKGCISCFACKRKGVNTGGHCIIKDDLTGVLDKILQCDVLLLGSPIYLGNITGEMQCLIERLLFPSISYEESPPTFGGNIVSGFIYTMNMGKYLVGPRMFEHYQSLFTMFGKPSEILLVKDTYQFDDYEKYETSRFSIEHKNKVREEQFPIDCQKAFEMGVRLVSAGSLLR